MRPLLNQSVKLKLAEEYPPPQEQEFLRELVAIQAKKMVRSDDGTFLRNAHSKHHACVRAEFTVDPDLPEDFRVGVFKLACTYPAILRFSNSLGMIRPDSKRDARGLAIKLLEVEGEKLLIDKQHEKAQDFMLNSHNVFVARNVEDCLNILNKPRLLKLLWFFFNPFDPHVRQIPIGLRLRKRIASPLDIRYWSMLPYLFGPKRAVKYSVMPCAIGSATIPRKTSDNYLREAMQQRLANEAVHFDFMIQFQNDPYTMPIEDATIAWDEAISPFRKVATIKIPMQQFDSPEELESCEHLTFNPWHSLAEHRPLGGINRARKIVYQTVSELRHQRNGVSLYDLSAHSS